MPIDPITAAALIGGGAGLLDGVFRTAGQNRQNKANRELAEQQAQWNRENMQMENQFNVDMFNRTNEWNLEHWNRVNEYNSPQEQMARLAEAGLNPHLIYGSKPQGAAGTAGPLSAQQQSSASVKPYTRAEARNIFEGFDTFSEILNNAQKSILINTQEQQIESIKQDIALKATENVKKTAETDRLLFDLGLSKDLRNTSIQAAIANANKATQEARKATKEAEISGVNLETLTATQQATIKKAYVQLEQANQELTGSKLRNELQAIKNMMMANGITDSDNVLIRMISMNPNLQSLLPLAGAILNIRRPHYNFRKKK